MTDAIMVPSCNRSGGSILRRRPLLSLLAILISLCIILSCTLWRKLNLQRYFGTNTRKQKIDVPIILSLNEEEEKGTKKLQPKADTGRSSPACRPHFQLALPDGKWSDSIKFKRLYFYHVRKAGVRILKRITCMHLMHLSCFVSLCSHHCQQYLTSISYLQYSHSL